MDDITLKETNITRTQHDLVRNRSDKIFGVQGVRSEARWDRIVNEGKKKDTGSSGGTGNRGK